MKKGINQKYERTQAWASVLNFDFRADVIVILTDFCSESIKGIVSISIANLVESNKFANIGFGNFT